MESKANYTVVGIFVIILSMAIIYTIIWLSAGISNKHYSTFVAYFSESVSGLNDQAPVKYNGVQVGYVSHISLNQNDPSEVKLELRIEQSVPVHVDTTATLESQGITGIVFVGLRGGSLNSPKLKALSGEMYPVIATRPSLFFRLDLAMSSLTNNLDRVTMGLHQLLSEPNQLALQNSLANIQQFTAALATNKNHVSNIIKNVDIALQNIATASGSFPELIRQGKIGFAAVQHMANALATVGSAANHTFTQSDLLLNNVNAELMPKIASMLEQLNSMSAHLNALTTEVQQQPAILWRGKTPPPPGPGE